MRFTKIDKRFFFRVGYTKIRAQSRLHFAETRSMRALFHSQQRGSHFRRQAARKRGRIRQRRFDSPQQPHVRIRYILCAVSNIIKQLPRKYWHAASNHTRIWPSSNSWLLRGEWLHYDFGRASHFNLTFPFDDVNARTVDVARAALSYKF